MADCFVGDDTDGGEQQEAEEAGGDRAGVDVGQWGVANEEGGD
jgi:hypothetical protein